MKSIQAESVDIRISRRMSAIAVSGELPPGAIIYGQGLAELFSRHSTTIRRSVQRGELPPPVRMFGTNTWTARALVQHIEMRPSRKGITATPDNWPAFMDGVQRLEEEMERRELLAREEG